MRSANVVYLLYDMSVQKKEGNVVKKPMKSIIIQLKKYSFGLEAKKKMPHAQAQHRIVCWVKRCR